MCTNAVWPLCSMHWKIALMEFQPLTSWRLSEAVSVSMVWMLSDYYSCLALDFCRASFFLNSKLVHFNATFSSSHSTGSTYQIWLTPIRFEQVLYKYRFRILRTWVLEPRPEVLILHLLLTSLPCAQQAH